MKKCLVLCLILCVVLYLLSAGLLSNKQTAHTIPSDEEIEHNIPSDEAAEHDIPSDEAAERDIPSDEATEHDVSSDEAAEHDIPSDEAAERDIPSDEEAEHDIPSDEAVETAYTNALLVYGWFGTGFPRNFDDAIEFEGYRYERFEPYDNPTFQYRTYSEFKEYLYTLFSDKIVDELLNKQTMIIDVDNQIYALGADRGGDVTVGNTSHSIIRESDSKIVYNLIVDLIEPEAWYASEEDYPKYVYGKRNYYFTYEYLGDGRWVFTNFDLYY